jgi:hypothetical protein
VFRINSPLSPRVLPCVLTGEGAEPLDIDKGKATAEYRLTVAGLALAVAVNANEAVAELAMPPGSRRKGGQIPMILAT